MSLIHQTGDHTKAQLIIAESGGATFVTKLSDGTGVISYCPLSQSNQAVFFTQLYAGRAGSFGGQVTLSDLLATQRPLGQPFWWLRPKNNWENLFLRSGNAAE